MNEKRQLETKQDSDWNLVERERLIVHKGKTILLDDYTNTHSEEAVRIILLHTAAAVARDKCNVLNLVDVTGSYADRNILKALKDSAKSTKDYYNKTAVIGCVGVMKFFLHIVNKFASMDVKPFDTREEALDWLVKKEKK